MGSAKCADSAKIVRDRKIYCKPRLVIYGQVKALTGSITGGGTGDGIGMQMAMTMSSILLKQNLARIGEHPAGFGIYLFDYKPEFRDSCGDDRNFGVMAEEVEQVMPEAVSIARNGFKCVDYDRLGISLSSPRSG